MDTGAKRRNTVSLTYTKILTRSTSTPRTATATERSFLYHLNKHWQQMEMLYTAI